MPSIRSKAARQIGGGAVSLGINGLLWTLLVFFVIFVALKGTLSKYLSFLIFAPAQEATPNPAGGSQEAVNDPSKNAIPGQDATGNPTMFPNFMGIAPPTDPGAGQSGGTGAGMPFFDWLGKGLGGLGNLFGGPAK